MLLNEFMIKMEKYGIPLRLMNFHINEIDESSNSTYILKEDENWSIYEVDERNNTYLVFSGDEDSAFEELFDIVFYRMRGMNYRNQYITESVIKTSYDVVSEFLKTKYGLDEQGARETWGLFVSRF